MLYYMPTPNNTLSHRRKPTLSKIQKSCHEEKVRRKNIAHENTTENIWYINNSINRHQINQ
jgi:hypothetical protein